MGALTGEPASSLCWRWIPGPSSQALPVHRPLTIARVLAISWPSRLRRSVSNWSPDTRSPCDPSVNIRCCQSSDGREQDELRLLELVNGEKSILDVVASAGGPGRCAGSVGQAARSGLFEVIVVGLARVRRKRGTASWCPRVPAFAATQGESTDSGHAAEPNGRRHPLFLPTRTVEVVFTTRARRTRDRGCAIG